MATNLKKYIKRAKDLEVALYTQKRLMDLYEVTAKKNIPSAPTISKITAPKKPAEPPKPDPYRINKANLLFWLGGVVFIALITIFCPTDITILFVLPARFVFSLLFIVFIFGSMFCVLDEIKRKELYQFARKQYVMQLSKYNPQYEKYKVEYENYTERKKKIETQHEIDLVEYKKELNAYNENRKQISQKHKNIYNAISAELKKHYSQNVLLPKYQNIVAVTSIYDYLQNGSCNEIDETYILFENDLQQSKIIGLLPLVVENLEQIKDNQPTLYKELKKANGMIDEIIDQIKTKKSDAKLLEYFSTVTDKNIYSAM